MVDENGGNRSGAVTATQWFGSAANYLNPFTTNGSMDTLRQASKKGDLGDLRSGSLNQGSAAEQISVVNIHMP